MRIKTYVEYFTEDSEKQLYDPEVSENEKEIIYYSRARYFEQMGIIIDKKSYQFDTSKDWYECYMQQAETKKIIPSFELAEELTELRLTAYDEFSQNFVYGSQDFIKNMQEFTDTTENRRGIYYIKKGRKVAVMPGADEKGFKPILSYTVRANDHGELDWSFLHEICHAIEATAISGGHRVGFEFFNDNAPGPINPYNLQKRKYERLNETITDIFAIEAVMKLRGQGKYLFEAKEHVTNPNNCNTHSIVKQLLTPFIDKYRVQIIKARMFGDMEELYSVIGEENFEELNDVVNRVDSFIETLIPDLDAQRQTPIVEEYYDELKRLDIIYEKMEEHRLRGIRGDNLLKSAIEATEDVVTENQINSGFFNFVSACKQEQKNNVQRVKKQELNR